MALIVHSTGTYSLLVDQGRPRTRSLGIPLGGAADVAAYTLGNALVGNPAGAVALEFTLAGPTLEANAEHGCVVYGAAYRVWINDRPQPVGKTFTLRSGDLLTISTPSRGLRGYLCVCGGFAAKEVLGSRSAFEPICGGQELECAASRVRPRFAPQIAMPATRSLTENGLLRVLPGSHLSQFPAEQFFGEEYTVRPESDRMGLRLSGKAMSRTMTPPSAPSGEKGRNGEEQLSAPVCPGTVQITHDGLPIVLGVDAQTIGGYPRIAHVIAAELDKLAQLGPEERLRFRQIDQGESVRLWRARQAWLHEWVTRLRNSWL